MHWLNRHARLRDQLSPRLDDALSSAERASLEKHLETCEACRAELDELRTTIAATRELPQFDAPRSFVLTPQMLERRAVAPKPSPPPLALGMRLASAGVAVLLAVVVIGDLSSVGGGFNGAREVSDDLGASRMTAEFAAEADVDKADSGAVAPAPDTTDSAQGYELQPPAEDATAAAGSDTSGCPAGAGGSGGGTGAGGTAETPAATPIPQPPATPTPELRAEAASGCEEQPIAGAVAPTTSVAEPKPAPDSGDETLSSEGALNEDEDSAVSTVRALEIVLAGTLIALVAGIAVEFALRRRRAV